MSIHDLFAFTGIAFTLLFPLINPIGAVPAFSSLMAHDTPEFRRAQARKTALNVTIILLVFLFVGHLLLDLFGISIGVLRIAGGLIVGKTAWDMVTSKADPGDDENKKIQNIDISFMPMAMPILSGPGAIGAVIGLSFIAKDFDDYAGYVLGILLLGLVTYLLLILSLPLMKKLGRNGINVLTRMMGFFILAIAVNLIYSGVMDLIAKSK
jgi:multiple antibiotic resistance protein